MCQCTTMRTFYLGSVRAVRHGPLDQSCVTSPVTAVVQTLPGYAADKRPQGRGSSDGYWLSVEIAIPMSTRVDGGVTGMKAITELMSAIRQELMSFEQFNDLYCALTGHDGACRWQYRLFADLEAGRFPTDIELATGLGKTSIIALWVLTLAHALGRSPCPVPRRLAYVVDRRVVVDQASEFADEICARLDAAVADERNVLYSLASKLRDAGCTPAVVEISTLRGQRALDTRWRDDPSRPAIIAGTVDMIGSRLLFSAYGRVGPWGRSLEAGLLGQDCLLVLDDLAMTSKYPEAGARPDVSRWLHGSVEEAALYIEFAWRLELDWITNPEGAARLLKAFPIAARETARCPLYEAVAVLGAVRARAMEDPALGQRVLLVIRFDTTSPLNLRALPEDEAELRRLIRNSMIVLPPSAGGYDQRFIDPAARGAIDDVADEAQPSTRARRRRLWVSSGRVSMTAAGSPDANPQRIDIDTTEDELIAEAATAARTLLGAGWRLIDGAGDAHAGVIIAREDRRAIEEAEDDDASLGFRNPILLNEHLGDARSKAEAFCHRLPVPADLRKVVVEAAGKHDLGKDRPWWQRAVGRADRPAVAKSWQQRFDHKINRGYRHELGSVADLEAPASLESFEPALAELCLHLVAAHHGHARPGFRTEAAGPLRTEAVKRVLATTPARFARMQATYGWWGLAWLEALVKAADVLASREEEEAAP